MKNKGKKKNGKKDGRKGRPRVPDDEKKVNAPYRITPQCLQSLEDVTDLSGGQSMGVVAEEIYWEGVEAVRARYTRRKHSVAQNPTFPSAELRS